MPKKLKLSKSQKNQIRNGIVDPRLVIPTALYNKVLEEVNGIRTACGLKAIKSLPTGFPGDPASCPIAVALKPLDPEVAEEEIALTIPKNKIQFGPMRSTVDKQLPLELTSSMKRFIKCFDDKAADLVERVWDELDETLY